MINFQQSVPYEQSRLGDERGIALIVYLFVLAAMSALAVAAIQITNLGFILALLIAFVAPTLENGELYFWISGFLVGIFMGPNQSASRSLMGRMIPPNKENEFYGFFAFSGKATAFFGPLLFTLVIDFTGDMRWSMLMLAVMFFIGMYILNGLESDKSHLKNS